VTFDPDFKVTTFLKSNIGKTARLETNADPQTVCGNKVFFTDSVKVKRGRRNNQYLS